MWTMTTSNDSPILRSVILCLIAAFISACATLPPRAQTQDLKSIAGKWEGYMDTPKGRMTGTDNIREDGTDEWTTGNETGTITFTVDNGVLRWKSTSGRTGTATLHEGDGKRVMIWTIDGCQTCKGVYTPAQ